MSRFKYILALLLIAFAVEGFAQQNQHYSQYRFVGLTYNPAFAGTEKFFDAFAIHRSQWSGINDAPRTYQLGLHAPSASGKMGFGGHLFTDVTGPTRRFGLQGAYAYHIQTSYATKLALGLSFGLTQFILDGSQITLREEGDQTLTNSMQSELKPDASFGILWYGEKFYAGLSAAQLLNNKLDLFPGDGDGRMAVHFYATGAYRFDLGEHFSLEPSLLLKYVDPVPVQADISARILYDGNLWLGTSYRTSDAVAIFAGYRIMNYLTIGYAYDITTSDIRNYSDGSHEILLQVQFGKKQMTDPDN